MRGLPFRVQLALVWWYFVRRHFARESPQTMAKFRTWVLDRIPADDHPKLFERRFVRRCIGTRGCQACNLVFERNQDMLMLNLGVTYIRQAKGESGELESIPEPVDVDPFCCCSGCYFSPEVSMMSVSGIEVRHIGSNGVPGNGQIIMNFVCKPGARTPAFLTRVPGKIQRAIAKRLMKSAGSRDAQHLLEQVISK